MECERAESTLFEKVTRGAEFLRRWWGAVIHLRKSREVEEEFYNEAEGTREFMDSVGVWK